MGSKVDWNHPEIHIRPSGQRRKRYQCTCLVCGHTRWLEKNDAQKAEEKDCFKCSQTKKAPKGFKAAVAKHGVGFGLDKLSAYRMAHPSSLEVEMMNILDEMQLPYHREVRIENKLVDFLLDDRHVIEVNGDIHKFKVAQDTHKAHVLREAGYKLLVIRDADMNIAPLLISEFVGQSIHKAAA